MALFGILFKNQRTVIGSSVSVPGFAGPVGGIGGIVIDATISEEHNTSCDLTENPVEDGAKITDHVQIKPAELSIEGVISDSPLGTPFVQNFQNIVDSVGVYLGKTSRSIDAYNKLLDLQNKREPFTVTTGLKQYKNMIMTKLSVPRKAEMGGSLQFKATLREIRIVKSKSGGLGGALDSVKKGAKNLAAKTKDLGQKVTQAVPAKSPISSSPAATTTSGKGSQLFNFASKIKSLF